MIGHLAAAVRFTLRLLAAIVTANGEALDNTLDEMEAFAARRRQS